MFKQRLRNEWKFRECSEEECSKQRKEPEDRVIRFDIFEKQKQDQNVQSVITRESRDVR